MDMNQRTHAAVKLRAEFHRHSRLRLEYLAAMSRLLREHGIAIDDDSLANMVPADIAELHGDSPPGGPAQHVMAGGPRPAPQTMVGGPRPAPQTMVGGPRPAPQTMAGGPRPAPQGLP